MITIYNEEDYAKAYKELLEILKKIPDEDLKKIPKNKIETYIKNQDNNHEFNFDTNTEFEKQNILKLTKILLANLYIEYWATEEERSTIKNSDKIELEKLEEQKKEKYCIEKMFKERKEKNEVKITSITVVKEKNIIQKIIDTIKKIFNFR